MNRHEPRIFARRVARELRPEELEAVAGGIRTLNRNTGGYGLEDNDSDAYNDGNTY
jgi:hypothetical protein